MDQGTSGPQPNDGPNSEDFTSLLNLNSKENREMTINTAWLITIEITSQVVGKLDEPKEILNYQIQETTSATIAEKVLLSIQNTLRTLSSCLKSNLDRQSIELHGSPAPKLNLERKS